MNDVVETIRVLVNLVRQGRYNLTGDDSTQLSVTLQKALSLAASLENADRTAQSDNDALAGEGEEDESV
jgi:hypothetical protein